MNETTENEATMQCLKFVKRDIRVLVEQKEFLLKRIVTARENLQELGGEEERLEKMVAEVIVVPEGRKGRKEGSSLDITEEEFLSAMLELRKEGKGNGKK